MSPVHVRRLLPVTALCVLLAAGSAPVLAEPLADALAAGRVGERPDGLIGAVTPDAGARALVERVNAERMARYRDIAERNGRPLAEVQALAGRRLTGGATDGQYVMDAAGRWQRR